MDKASHEEHVPADMTCSLSGVVMTDPVTLHADGMNYERSVLELWLIGLPQENEGFDDHGITIRDGVLSPTQGTPLVDEHTTAQERQSPWSYFTENYQLRERIQLWHRRKEWLQTRTET